jgi:hypothetical protein
VFPLIDKLLYDPKDDVRDKAIHVLAEIRTIAKEEWKDNVLRLILCMAHDEKDNIKESAVKLLNEVSADMGQEYNEGIIVNELRGLGSIEEASNVKCTIVQNLHNISRNISLDVFTEKMFPLYDQLAQDKEWKVRKTCADVVAQIGEVAPLDRPETSQKLQVLYYRFLQDASSKIVRGTAF